MLKLHVRLCNFFRAVCIDQLFIAVAQLTDFFGQRPINPRDGRIRLGGIALVRIDLCQILAADGLVFIASRFSALMKSLTPCSSAGIFFRLANAEARCSSNKAVADEIRRDIFLLFPDRLPVSTRLWPACLFQKRDIHSVDISITRMSSCRRRCCRSLSELLH